jgi:hypothetical protein
MSFEEPQVSTVPLSKIDYYIQSEQYINSLILPTEKDIGTHGITTDEELEEERENVCSELFSQAVKWSVSIKSITPKNFSFIKGSILLVIRERLESLEEAEEEIQTGGLPPQVGLKKFVPEAQPEKETKVKKK